MAASDTGAWFPTTSWALVLSARGSRADLEVLLRAYWSPVYAFIRAKGFSHHDASDMTQEFLAEVLVGRDLIAKADPMRGRFRSFLKSALRNFLIDQHRRASAKRAAPSTPISSVDAGPEAIDPASIDQGTARGRRSAGGDPATAFDRQWAAAVLALTIERTEAACKQDGMEQQWAAFRAVILAPLSSRVKSPPMDELAERLGAASPAQVSNMIQTVKRRFRRTLQQVVAETVTDPNDIESELAALQRFFG
jgi:DNA-directed RNA polymerase specialized sigma24 family protein